VDENQIINFVWPKGMC